MAAGSLIGGLQSSTNPGVNMTPAVRLYRPTRKGLSIVKAAPPKPTTGKREPGIAHPQPTPATPGVPAVPPAPFVPPGGHATGFAAPGASLLTFDQWIAGQPGYIAQHAHDVDARNQLLATYGFYQDANGKLIADPKAAQDSLIANLDLRRQQGIGQTAQVGANRGNLFSGASLIGVQGANDAYRTGAAKALSDLTGKVGDIDQKEIDTKLGLQPDYTDYVGNTKTAKPEDALAKTHAMGAADAVASIDKYVKAYAKYLTPAQLKAFQQERARQVNIYNHQQKHKQVMAAAAKRAAPKPKRKKKRRPPTNQSGHTGGIAGGSTPPPNMVR